MRLSCGKGSHVYSSPVFDGAGDGHGLGERLMPDAHAVEFGLAFAGVMFLLLLWASA